MMLSLALFLFPCVADALSANVKFDPSKRRSVDGKLLSFTSDFHAPESKCQNHTHCWKNSTIFNVNLSSPRLFTAASNLAPAIWRIGGSPADETFYEFGSTSCPQSCAPLIRQLCGDTVIQNEHACKKCEIEYATTLAKHCSADQLKDVCTLQGDDAFYCLRPARWNEILSFAEKTGVKVVFGLNYLSHINASDPQSSWNSSNARELLQYTYDNDLHIFGLELGNELNMGPREPNASRLGKAFEELQAMIASIWKSEPHLKPILYGPDVSYPHDPGNQYLMTFVRSFVPDAVTFHDYPAGKIVDGEKLLFSPEFYREVAVNYSNLASEVHAIAPSAEVVWGEGAFQFHSGTMNVTNAFEDMLFVAVQLGELPHLGITKFFRQTLFGGFYEMLDHDDNFSPNPDWWFGVLFKKLIGSSTTYKTYSSVDALRAYVYSSCGSTTALLVNIGLDTINVTVDSGSGALYLKNQYKLTATNGDLNGRGVNLNDHGPLTLPADGKMPQLKPHVSSLSAITLPGRSVMFASDANSDDSCKGDEPMAKQWPLMI